MDQRIEGKVAYRMFECIGEGLNGSVFRATREDLGSHLKQEVALKILKSKNLVEKWRREFQSLSQVRSKHCVQVLGFDWIEDKPVLVLEYVRGANLGQILREQDVSLAELECIFAQVREGLEDLAKDGLFHGDLSLSNILVDTEGGVRLIDFGLGNNHDEEREVTVEFAAPQILQGERPNLESDFYSLEQIKKFIDSRFGFDQKKWIGCSETQTDAEIRKRLGQKVEQLLDERRALPGTVPLKKLTSAHSTFSLSLRQRFYLQIAAVLLLSLLVPKSALSESMRPPGWLSVRTSFWIYLSTDKEIIGYGPIVNRPLLPGRITLKWQTAKHAGSRTLTLHAGDSIVLTDTAF